MARQADGSALVRYGDTVVLVAAVSGPPRAGIDFFPLQVDYREKTYSAGKFPGGFFKREGRPTLKEILTMRLTDRPIRPLFPEGYKQDLQIYATVLSFDQKNDPDIPAIIGASAALSVSKIPFLGPIGAVRMGLVDGEFVVNPEHPVYEKSAINLVICGTHGNLSMVEGEAKEVSEENLLTALEKGQEVIDALVSLQEELIAAHEIPEKEIPDPVEEETGMVGEIEALIGDRLEAALRTKDKMARRDAVRALRDNIITSIVPEDLNEEQAQTMEKGVKSAFEEILHNSHRRIILSGTRVDGRGYQEVRPITVETSLLPRTHGSALFTRGETQALVVLTLGTMDNEQRIDGLLEEYRKKFLLHYNFPSFSVGETKPIRGPGRREIGHGFLAERSIEPILPPWESFPYTVRIVSDILESNGSSSMATVCGASLALMDGGVPLTRHVAGIAMGLLLEEGKTCILSDIIGDEDHHGDMDLKVAGTKEGVTGLQMDIKIDGISRDIIRQALDQAREGRLHILAEMDKGLPTPRESLSEFAPIIAMVMVDVEKIGVIIGPGGKTIKKIQTEFEVEIDVEDDGRVSIASTDRENLEKAKAYIQGLITSPEIGNVYEGTVTSIKDFGAFVEILPGTEGLVHISEMGSGYVERVDDVVKLGQKVTVKCLNIDDAGKVKLTMRMGEDGSPPRRPGPQGSGGSGGRGSRRPPPRGRDRDRGGGGGRGRRRDGGGRPPPRPRR
jgi:polyribonucleotide nucleotidyltransferase